MTDALPRSQLGITTLVLSAWLHFFIGVTIGNILKWFSISHLLTVSKGYLSQAWNRLAQILTPWYEEIKDQAKDSAVLNVDESGWRNNGVTCWLWCFTNKTLALFTIEQSRGSPVLFEILGELFPGVLISDFFGAYNKIKAFAKQRCIVHLLREIKKVSLRNTSAEWVCFARKVKCLFKDAVLLAKDRDTLSKQKYETKKERLYQRLRSLYSAPYEDKDCRRFETLVI
jgi:transposase